MSRIFISHSSVNNPAALAMEKWLAENGWEDCYLDVSPARGLSPGERWQEALKAAADRCEAVLFLITPSWRDSRWCLAEFLLAKQLGKTIFGVLVEATPLKTLPPEMTAEWQLCDLATGTNREIFRVALDPIVPETEVSFARGGLDRLKRGLEKAGLDASTFRWPPKNDPERSPYPGLRPLEAEDAAVFFGRDTAIVRGLDALRGLRERGVERMLVILGASGAGKSSFLRAGLWPRLARDDRHFLPLPVIRPEHATLSGANGLAASLETALRDRSVPKNRADIRKALELPGGLNQLLVELQARASPQSEPEEPPPTVVLSIDQGEELFGTEGRAEAELLLDRLAETLAPPETKDAEAIATRRRAMLVVAMRSDSYERLQSEPKLAQVRPRLFDLPPIERTQYKSVIEGPAARATAAGSKLKIDPHLTERLLQDTEGADALPLLAFSLERLFVEHGADGDLKLGEYEDLGGVRGSIEAAIEAAFSEPGQSPAIPENHAERSRRLREGFIPWLASVDPDTEERKRRVAEWEEIPEDARPLLERLLEARLLKRDLRRTPGSDETTVLEIAHEALLRQWPMLTSWLDEDTDDLKALDALRRAAEAWARNERVVEWLVHTGERLSTAEALRRRGDFKRLLSEEGESYLRACRRREDEVRQKERRQLRRTRMALAATLALAAVTLTMLGWAVLQQRKTQKALAATEFLAATREARDGKMPQALAHFARTLRLSPGHAAARHAVARLLILTAPVRAVLRHEDEVTSASFSPDGTRVVTASEDRTARVWDATSGQPLGEPLRHEDKVFSSSFSPDGRRVVTASWDRTARVWDAKTGQPLGEPLRHEGALLTASFSPDGTRVLTASQRGEARVWEATTGQLLWERQHGGYTLVAALFSPDGTMVVTASADTGARVWDAKTGQPLGEPLRHESAEDIAFSRDGTRVLTLSSYAARVWDVTTGQPLGESMVPGCSLVAASISPDGTLIVTACMDEVSRPVQVWDATTGRALAGLPHPGVFTLSFGPGGARVVTASSDGTARVWEATTGQPLGEPMRHEEGVTSASFSPDGTRVVTASDDRTARVWDATTGQPLGMPLGYGSVANMAYIGETKKEWVGQGTRWLASLKRYAISDFNSVIFSPDGSRLVTASENRSAQIWDATTGQPLGEPMRHEEGVTSASFSPDGTRVVTASDDWTARVWDATTGQPLGEPLRHGYTVNSASFSPDGSRVVTASWDRTAQVWDTSTGAPVGEPLRHEEAVWSASFSPDGRRVVTASSDSTARLWDATTGQPLGEPMRHEEGVTSGSFSPDGRRVVTASSDSTARVWDAKTGQPLGEPMRHRETIGGVHSALFSPDGTHVVTASSDWSARLWDATTGQPLGEPFYHQGTVSAASFNVNGTLVVTASEDGSARLFDATTGSLLTLLVRQVSGVSSASFSPDGMRVVTASEGGIARVWDVFGGQHDDAGLLASLAETFGGYSLSEVGAPFAVPDRNERLQTLRVRVEELTDDAPPVALLARWLLADPWRRTISPFSRMTAQEYICQCLQHRAYEEAQRAFLGHPLLRGGPEGPLPEACSQPET